VVAQHEPIAISSSSSSVIVRRFVAPVYPVAVWLTRLQGRVVTQAIIKADGTVKSVKFVSAHPMFRKSVEDALEHWNFEVSAATDVTITIEFKLDTDCPLSGSEEAHKRYYPSTRVSADLPSKVEVESACLSR
jgi:TonB family protein